MNLHFSPIPHPIIVRFLIVLCLFLLAGCGDIPTDKSPAPSVPTSAPASSSAPSATGDGDIEVFFTTPFLVYPDVPDQRTPPPHEQAILADIDGAQRSVELVSFDYNLPSVADALIRAHERGVAVRVALDEGNREKPEMDAWATMLEDAGIPISWETGTRFLHSKFIIIDDEVVWTGSWNVSTNDTYRNNNNILRITNPELVENYLTEFGQMFDGAFGNQKQPITPNPIVETGTARVENYFSPRDGVLPNILNHLEGAEESIRFLAFSFTTDEIGAAMIDKHNAGLEVRGVFENRNAKGQGSKFEPLERAGVDVLTDGNCYTMHHKVIIIDDHTVITGSYNFSKRAEDTNDENLLIIEDPAITALFIEEFDRVYAQAREPTKCGR